MNEIAGRPLVDLSLAGARAVRNEHEERRHVFTVLVPEQNGNEAIQYHMQARSSTDQWQWMAVINNVALVSISEMPTPRGSGVNVADEAKKDKAGAHT